MGKNNKFERLKDFFYELKEDEITMTFNRIEKIIGEKLPDSAYKYPAYWSPSETHTITKCWIEQGYTILHLSMNLQQITFKKNSADKSISIQRARPRFMDDKLSKSRKYPAVNIEEVLLGINKFYIDLEADENARYLSWEHCYKIFKENHNKTLLTDNDIDYLSLHLAFYLASWGMLRGSSFLLQKDYKVHIDIIKELFKPCYNQLWGISYIELQSKESLNALMDLIANISNIYSTKRKNIKEVDKGISDILVTKVLLGTLGCAPAYDEYFKKGVAKCNVTTQLLSKASIMSLAEYYQDNEIELEKVRKSISNSRKLEYPPMKILDMAFWQIGFDNK